MHSSHAILFLKYFLYIRRGGGLGKKRKWVGSECECCVCMKHERRESPYLSDILKIKYCFAITSSDFENENLTYIN